MSSLYGTAGDDTLVGTAGDDVFYGYAGTDTGQIDYSMWNSVFSVNEDWQWVVTGNGLFPADEVGTDTLDSIESARFIDGTVTLEAAPPGEAGVNTAAADEQKAAAVAGLPDGSYVVSWASLNQDGSEWGVYARRFDSTGSAIGPEFRVNTSTGLSQTDPSIATLGDGGFVVTWTGRDAMSGGIFGQRYDANGQPAGGEFLVNTGTDFNQWAANVSALDGGGFVVAWMWDMQGETEIYAQQFDASGAKLGAEKHVNTTMSGFQVAPDVTGLSDGGYLVAWTDFSSPISFFPDVYAQRYDSSGVRVGGETRLNQTTLYDQGAVAIAALSDGGYVVAYKSTERNNLDHNIYAQAFALDGTLVGPEVKVNTTSLYGQWYPSIGYPSVAALEDGGYVVTWELPLAQDGRGWEVYAQRFDGASAPVGGEILVNTTTAGDQSDPHVAALSDGGYVVTWSSPDESGSGIFAQRFDANGQREGHFALFGDDAPNRLFVDSSPEGVQLVGNGGQDELWGTAAADVLTGGSGSDTFYFSPAGNGVDLITDWGTGDRIVVAGGSFTGTVAAGTGESPARNEVQASTEQGMTTLYIGTDDTPGADVTIHLAGTFLPGSFKLDGMSISSLAGFTFTGKGLIEGGPGDDTLISQGSFTQLVGGYGNDIYRLGNPADQVIEQANGGIDGVETGWNYTLPASVENLSLSQSERPTRATGNELDNVITGNGGRNVITGLLGADMLSGQLGADRFVYTAVEDSLPSGWDVIGDFSSGEGDTLDLRQIDADAAAPGHQHFIFIGSAAFDADATGELRYDGSVGFLSASIDADAELELLIHVGVPFLTAGNILL